jgi:hypothetical protein
MHILTYTFLLAFLRRVLVEVMWVFSPRACNCLLVKWRKGEAHPSEPRQGQLQEAPSVKLRTKTTIVAQDNATVLHQF